MLDTLKHFFIPHTGNNYHPYMLHTKRVFLYGMLGIAVKAIALLTAILMPLQVFVMADVLTLQEKRIVELTNEVRAEYGIPMLVYDARLYDSSRAKAEDMAGQHYFEHVSPEGKRLRDFLKESSYDFAVAGENLAVGFATPEEVVEAWIESPTHFSNLIDPDYRHIGVGSAIGEFHAHSSVYVAQHFGNPLKQYFFDTATVSDKRTPLSDGTRVLGISVVSTDPPQIYFDPSASYVSWKMLDTHRMQLSVQARIVGEPTSAIVEVEGYQIPLYPALENGLWAGTLTVFSTPDTLFDVVLTPSITIEWPDSVRTISPVQWKEVPSTQPDMVEKYRLSERLPGIFGSPFSVAYAILYGMAVFFTITLILKIFIEIRRQHYHVIGSSLLLIGLLILLAIA